jgi:sulfur carrier protein
VTGISPRRAARAEEVRVSLNGRDVRLPAGATVGDALELLAVPAQRGFAVAVDAEVVPRGEWKRRVLDDGAQIEVVTAIQGG